MNQSYDRLEVKGNLAGLMPCILKVFLGFEAWNLKDSCLTHDSEHIKFKPHDNLGKINNTNKSNSLHIINSQILLLGTFIDTQRCSRHPFFKEGFTWLKYPSFRDLELP